VNGRPPETDGLDLLIVDDNRLDRELVRRLLAREYRVCEAATAQEAEECLAEQPVDLVLLDNRLPDMDGIDLLPLFAGRHLPVIMLTEIETPEIIVQAMQRGAQDYLVKGALTPESLSRAIRNALEKATLRRTLAEQQAALAEQAATLEARNRDIHALASALTLAEQAERRRIAELLHDHVQQLLLGARLHLQMLESADAAERRGLVAEVNRILQDALQATRELAVDLTPPALDSEELEEALRWLADHMSRLYRFHVEVEAESPGYIPSLDVRVLLVRLVRELVFNAVKHAGVDQARVRLAEEGGNVVITVEDRGTGFDVAETVGGAGRHRRGFGLYSVRERLELLGGRLEITSAAGQGTRATIHAPVVGVRSVGAEAAAE
jgi:signal transduction histidine kinase